MSLNWDLQEMKERLGQEEYDRITDHPNLPGEWHPATIQLIWSCLFIEMSSITEKNWEAFADRLRRWQEVEGDLLFEGPLTAEDVHRHIGLRTNVTHETEEHFRAKLDRLAARRAPR